MILPSPSLFLKLSFAIWLIAFLTIPATYVELGDSVYFAVFSLFMYNLFFIIGLYSVKKNKAVKSNFSRNKKLQILFVMFIFGFFGVVLRIYQRVFIQKLYLADNLVRTRMELLSNELNSGVVGLLSGVFYPFATIALLAAILWIRELNKTKFFLITLLGLFPIYDAFLSESRLIIILVIGMIFITFLGSNIKWIKSYITFKLMKVKLISIPSFIFRKKIFIPTIIVSFVCFLFFVKVMNNRLAVFAYKDTLSVWEYLHRSKMDNDFKNEVYSSNNVDKNKAIGLYSIKHYFAHSVIEYVRLVGHLEKSTGYYYGMVETYPYFKILKLAGLNIPSYSELNSVAHREGVYMTFWGPFYIDFGVFGVIVMFFLGRFSKRTYLNAKHGSEIDIVIYSFLGIVIFGSFFLNLVLGGNMYFVNAIIFFSLLCKLWPNNLVVYAKN